MEELINDWHQGYCSACQKRTQVAVIVVHDNHRKQYCIDCMEILKQQVLEVLAQRAVSN